MTVKSQISDLMLYTEATAQAKQAKRVTIEQDRHQHVQ